VGHAAFKNKTGGFVWKEGKVDITNLTYVELIGGFYGKG